MICLFLFLACVIIGIPLVTLGVVWSALWMTVAGALWCLAAVFYMGSAILMWVGDFK